MLLVSFGYAYARSFSMSEGSLLGRRHESLLAALVWLVVLCLRHEPLLLEASAEESYLSERMVLLATVLTSGVYLVL